MTTYMMKVTDLMKYVTYSIDVDDLVDVYDWQGLILNKAEDESLWALVDLIQENVFTTPICVARDADGWMLGNGHHRLVAAILLGLDEIPVIFSGVDADGNIDYMRVTETTTDGEDVDEWWGMVDVDWDLLSAIAA
jgi:hypothetical protein